MCVITWITFIRDSNITDDDVYIKTSEVVQCRSQVNYIVVLMVYLFLFCAFSLGH